MKTIYPLLTLLSATIVAAGPVPRHAILVARTELGAPTRLLARTEHVMEPAPAPAPAPEAVDAEAEKQKQADEKAGMYHI